MQNVHEILRRLMAVVVSSAFRKSLNSFTFFAGAIARERSQKFKVMRFSNLGSEKRGGFLQLFCRFSPGKRHNICTENFTTFFTARKEICHLELTLGASPPKELLLKIARFLGSAMAIANHREIA